MKYLNINKTTKYVLIILVVILSLLFNSCEIQNQGYEYVVGVSQLDIQDTLNTEFRSTLSDYNKTNDSTNFVFMDAAGDVIRQKNDLEKLNDMNVDAVIVISSDLEFLRDTLKEMKNSGVIVAIVGQEEEDSQIYDINIYPNNDEVGKAAGEYLGAELSGSANILEIVGDINLDSTAAISKEFRDELSGFTHMRIPFVLAGYGSRDITEARAIEILLKEPETDAVFAHSDAMAQGVRRALDNLGKDALIVSVCVCDQKGDWQSLNDKSISDATIFISTGAEYVALEIQSGFEGHDMKEKIEIEPILIKK